MPGALGRFSRLREFVLEFVLAAEQVLGRNAHTVELQLGGVRCAATDLVELADEFEALGAAGHDEKGLSSVAELLVDDGVDDVHAGDAAVADPHLVTVDDPVVAVTTCMRSQVANVAAAFGFGDRERGKLQIPRRTETFGRPLQHLLGRSGWPIAESASAGITIARPMPAQPQNSSSMNIGSDIPVGSPIRSR
jgi:hypothetical protein